MDLTVVMLPRIPINLRAESGTSLENIKSIEKYKIMIYDFFFK